MALAARDERARVSQSVLAMLGAASLVAVGCHRTKPSNVPPVALSQELAVDEDGVLSGQLAATTAPGGAVEFALLIPARHGRIALDAASGAFTYTPRRSFSGIDAFSFAATDGHATSAPAFVVVTVRQVDHPPVATDQAVLVPPAGTVTGVLWVQDDEDKPLTFAITQSPANGTLTFDPATRIFSYVAASGFVGDDSFQFTASDAHATSAPGTMSIHVTSTAPTGPQIQAQMGLATAATGQGAPMGVVASAATALYFVWWKDGVAIPGATTAAYTTPPVTLADSGTNFAVSVYDAVGHSMTSLSWTLVAFEARPGQRVEALFSNERVLFPVRDPLSILSIERLPSSIGAKVTFDPSSSGFPTLAATGDAVVVPDPVGNALFVAFADRGVPEVQSESVTLSLPGSSKSYTLGLSFTDAEWFAQQGLPGPATVTFTQMDVPLATTHVEDWIIGQPTSSDIAFATTTWGPVVAGLTSPTEKAQAIARSLIDALEGHRGVPSDALSSSPPFVQYQMAISGQGQVWCTNIAQILTLACQCFGIPARIFALGRTLSLGPYYNVLTNEGHATTEIFDETTNDWVWIDATLYVLGMNRAGVGLLNTVDMQLALNDPARVTGLFTLDYSPSTASMTVSNVALSPALPSLREFYGRETIPSIWKSGPQLPIEFHSNEHGVFPRWEDLAIRSLEPLAGGYGVRLELVSAVPGLDHFEYRQVGAGTGSYDTSTRVSVDGVVDIQFPDPHAPVPQSMQFAVKAVGASGTSSAEAVLTIYLYSTEYYASVGVSSPGIIIFAAGDLPYVSSEPDDWIVDVPSLADLEFAQAVWGQALSVAATPLQNARALAEAIARKLASRVGPTSATASISPFDRYRRAVSGTDVVDSIALAAIFSHACNAFGLPARIVEMSKVLSRDASYDLLGAEDHSAVEVFDTVGNRWVWFDLSVEMLGVELPGYGTLNSAELAMALNDPTQFSRLVAIWYDPVQGLESRADFALNPESGRLQKYFQAYPTLRYARLAQ